MREEGRLGTSGTRLLVLRGNSGSGKSTTARALRAQLGPSLAWVEQDHFRRIVLMEPDVPGGLTIALIEQTVRFLLNHGRHVVLEGILDAGRYGDLLRRLAGAHRGITLFCYFEVSFEETLRRHGTRPQASEFGPDQMAAWFRPADTLNVAGELTLSESASLAENTGRILRAAGLCPLLEGGADR